MKGLLVAVVVSCSWCAPAAAQGIAGRDSGSQASGAGADPAREQAADALFQQGKRLLGEARYSEACTKFEASQRLDPGLGTLLFLGECYEKLGKTASAWRAFERASALAIAQGDRERGRLARIRYVAVSPQLAWLRVRLANGTRRLEGLELMVNGVAVSTSELDEPLAVDPGEATLEATAPGHSRWEARLRIHDGPSTAVLDIPELGPSSPELGPRTAGSNEAGEDDRRHALQQPASSSVLGKVALVLGAAGLVGTGVGAYYGVRALDRADRSKALENCPLADRCYAQGLELRTNARQDGHVADVAVGVGVALLVAGVVLYVAAPAEASNAQLAYVVKLGAGGDHVQLELGADF